MSKFYKLRGLIVLLFSLSLSTASATYAHLPEPENPTRDVDTIVALYEGSPERHHISQASGAKTEPVQTTKITAPNLQVDETITYHSYANENWDVYIMNSAGTHRLTASGAVEAYPVLSENEQVIFSSSRSGNFELYRANRASYEAMTQLTHNAADDIRPTWSHRGDKIAFQSTRTGNNDIFVMNSDGSELRQMTTNSGFDGYPS